MSLSAHDQLVQLLALPYNPTRDLEPHFTALKELCRGTVSQDVKKRMHTAVYALYDVLRETEDPPSTRAEATYYPYNALPVSYWSRRG